MIENELLPDFVISLEDEEALEDFLLTRFVKIHNLPLPSTLKNVESQNEQGSEIEKEVCCVLSGHYENV